MNTTAVLPDTTAEFSAPADDTVRVPAQNSQGAPSAYEAPGDRPAAEPQANPGDNARAFAITSFVLGIASVVSGWTFIAPIAGLILGIIALRRNTSERTLALWGVWLNGIMLALAALAIVAFVLMLGAGLIALPFFAV
ncbi:DUF4190 domain-containing protein [Leucobacter tenebrionis]|uniref:DUF4190 domain-containing protein n=1 Tax=Leucobacter tenebrionis TaxID=2873270 RepID=UPI001CA69D53|nr:DUF4190 domain-containing protein [Leucobacter tenebrionis]QZY51265.1 DUF4190 domain-containing protein [Leucobacter tenebrionis]